MLLPFVLIMLYNFLFVFYFKNKTKNLDIFLLVFSPLQFYLIRQKLKKSTSLLIIILKKIYYYLLIIELYWLVHHGRCIIDLKAVHSAILSFENYCNNLSLVFISIFTGLDILKTLFMITFEFEPISNKILKLYKEIINLERYIVNSMNKIKKFDLNCSNLIVIDHIKRHLTNYDSKELFDILSNKEKINLKTLSQFYPEAAATEFLKLLTFTFDKELDYSDFHEVVRQINIERRSLINMINGEEYIRNVLKVYINTLHWFLFLVIALEMINKVNILTLSILPFLLFLLPIGVSMFDSFILIAYHKPFDIGDRVIIKDENLIVKSIGLTSTVFEKWNNEVVIYSNKIITGVDIKNIRRSKSQKNIITMTIPKKFATEKMNLVKKGLARFAEDDPSFCDFQMVYNHIEDSRYVLVDLIIKHSINHQNGYFTWYVQNRFMKRLLRELKENQVEYYPNELLVNVS